MTEDADILEQLQALFHLAEATPENERERILSENCSDPELLRRVTAIFHGAHIEVEVEPIQPWSGSVLSNKIGPYSILRHLGTGGLGSVYLAERMVGGVVQRSALKVLAPHAAGPAFIERFHREQHILASLEHPNITRMLGCSSDARMCCSRWNRSMKAGPAACGARTLRADLCTTPPTIRSAR